MAEQLFEHGEDENTSRSDISGELGKPSATWLKWLGVATATETDRPEETAPPARLWRPGDAIGSDDPLETSATQDQIEDQIEDIEEHPTTLLDFQDHYNPAPPPPPTSLFERRYGQGSQPSAPLHVAQPGAGGNQPRLPFSSVTTPLPSYQSGGLSFRHFHADLRERRAEDERLTGRRWPGNSILFPGNAHEALFFDQLAIAMGEVDPRLLARESALRYIRASRLPEEDDLAPTDVYAILYYGLGLILRPLDCASSPQVLAVYHRRSHEVYVDWTLLQDPPYGRATLDRTAWRRAVDGSPLARILVAWCVATHLAENFDVPLVLGFSPPISARSGDSAFSPAGAADLLNRYRKTMISFATLLAPQERLWQQISALQLGIHMGDPEWRAHLRSAAGRDGSTGGWRRAQTTGLAGGAWFPRQGDPVEQVINVLAERNNCPPSLIEWQLDGNTGVLDWDAWAVQLRREVPALQHRYAAAEQFFFAGKSTPSREGMWSTKGRVPRVQAVQTPLLRLTF